MKLVTQLNDWSFELKFIQARKCERYGEPFTANATITFVDGIAHVESTLAKEQFLKSDYKTLRAFLMSLGIEAKNIQYKRSSKEGFKVKHGCIGYQKQAE